MELKERLKFCNKCKNRKFDMNQGVVCNLTLRKPDFNFNCKDFVVDPVEEQKIEAKRIANSFEGQSTYGGGSKSKSGDFSVWGVIIFIVALVRLVMIFFRD